MKAQVLHKYDPEMKEKVWVTEQEMPDPKLEKSSDVIVKIGAAGVCVIWMQFYQIHQVVGRP